jgi:BirA family biotin operon repressor/biotin-[acetyl-CoA-carboxylase] ligase
MKKNTKIGSKITFLDSVDSTNNYAAKLVNENKIENGQVIMADFQGEGRGQRGATWHSERGMNILISIFLELDNLSVKNQTFISKFVAVSIYDALKTLGLQPKIKWPNDLLINGKKICGILIENQFTGHQIKSSIIGIGLNVNQVVFEIDKITSLTLELGTNQDRMSILGILINSFNKNMVYTDQNSDYIEKVYLQNLYLLEERSSFYNEKLGNFVGVITGIDNDGKLLVSIEERILSFDIKELKFC